MDNDQELPDSLLSRLSAPESSSVWGISSTGGRNGSIHVANEAMMASSISVNSAVTAEAVGGGAHTSPGLTVSPSLQSLNVSDQPLNFNDHNLDGMGEMSLFAQTNHENVMSVHQSTLSSLTATSGPPESNGSSTGIDHMWNQTSSMPLTTRVSNQSPMAVCSHTPSPRAALLPRFDTHNTVAYPGTISSALPTSRGPDFVLGRVQTAQINPRPGRSPILKNEMDIPTLESASPQLKGIPVSSPTVDGSPAFDPASPTYQPSPSPSPRLGAVHDKTPKKKPIRRLGRNRVVCMQCYKSKTKCDGIRPCARCIRMGKQTSCVDRPYLRRGGRPAPPKRRRMGDGSPRPSVNESPPQLQEITQLDISTSAVSAPSDCHVLSIEKDMKQVSRFNKLRKRVLRDVVGRIDTKTKEASRLHSHNIFFEQILVKRLRRYADGDQLHKMGFTNIDHSTSLKKDFKLTYSLASNEVDGLHHTNGGIPTISPVATIHISLNGSMGQNDVKYTLFFNQAAERLFEFTQNEVFQMFLYDSVPFLWSLLHPDDWKTKVQFLLESCGGHRHGETSCVVRVNTKSDTNVPCVATFKYEFNNEGLIEHAYSCFIPIPPSSYVPPPNASGSR